MHPLYHPAFVQFLAYFNGNQDYFECHEELEEYWKDIAPRQRKHPLTGWIQLATGLYHWRRGNFRGATTIIKKGYATLKEHADHPFLEKIEQQELYFNIESCLQAIELRQPYTIFYIKITDLYLLEHVEKQIKLLPDVSPEYIMHKHRLRDRTEVISERNASLARKHSL